jgi:alkylhydroperoxidase/carboxymuconolactone decarboxylase family protein YurZ
MTYIFTVDLEYLVLSGQRLCLTTYYEDHNAPIKRCIPSHPHIKGKPCPSDDHDHDLHCPAPPFANIYFPMIFKTPISTLLLTTAQPQLTMATNDSTPTRFPSTSQTPEQAAAAAEAERIILAKFGPSFQLKDADGNLLGPFSTLSYTPSTFLPYLDYANAFTSLLLLAAKERELAILATCSVTKSEYALYAHRRIGVSVGLTEEQVRNAGEGRIPEGLVKRERDVYVLALEMARRFGTLSDEVFEQAVGVIGRDGVSQLAQVVGGYLLGSVLINVADVKVPVS